MKLIGSRLFALALAAGVMASASLGLLGTSPASATTVALVGHHSASAVRNASSDRHAAASPDSGSGCTALQVCINVNGTGLNVQSVTGDVYPIIGSWCGYETLRGTLGTKTYIFVDSPTACKGVGGTYQYTWTLNQNFPNQMKMCLGQVTTSGTNPGGPACLTIHS